MGLPFVGEEKKKLRSVVRPFHNSMACCEGKKVAPPNITPWTPIPLLPPNTPSHVLTPQDILHKHLSTRDMQTNIGELPSFIPSPPLSTLKDLSSFIQSSPSKYFVIDSSEDDFGSRANFGRGHVHSEFQNGCLTSYEIFVKRLANIAINPLNESFAHSICVLGTIHSPDLTESCWNKTPALKEDRNLLKSAVLSHHQRLSSAVTQIYLSSSSSPRVYLVNGDHNHMLSAIQGVSSAFSQKNSHGSNSVAPVRPVVIYVDLHADSRPIDDGPHSGTWCSEAFANGWIEQAYCVGLNPLANSALTINNLALAGAIYEPYTWDHIKSGDISFPQIAQEVIQEIHSKHPNSPVILSICGDSVLHLPSSAGTGTIGYSADEMHAFVSSICKSLPVVCFTIAELKTSLNPSAAPLVGEFLTQSLFTFQRSCEIYHSNSERK